MLTMATSDPDYSANQEIADFSKKSSATRLACGTFAKQRLCGNIGSVSVQGVCSYTCWGGSLDALRARYEAPPLPGQLASHTYIASHIKLLVYSSYPLRSYFPVVLCVRKYCLHQNQCWIHCPFWPYIPLTQYRDCSIWSIYGCFAAPYMPDLGQVGGLIEINGPL
jgi:hypothetical protein